MTLSGTDWPCFFGLIHGLRIVAFTLLQKQAAVKLTMC